ncbi:hypothetical protein HF1_03480 [Mycoplasma haemofelis str. Langford 1]|uniref:Uncharacterized protein n=1 Tax=Mycoplasma haemofelis (strain Langford 1) TaxID=941640 RepID=E8ZGT5_MYCHL|nr:hypothetical protein [Mycoplasma haemofelis]CBY92356.1 hypothetical protein HF1_03480 [Mycoplasma haemofelis str. Langford 1]
MGKGVSLALGTAGAGGLGAGGLMALKPWQSDSPEKSKVVTSIREKYAVALLNTKEDSEIWTKKYTALGTHSPNNPILRDAASKKTGSSPNEGTIKQLLKEGCEAIYSSDANDPKNFSDFKALCSKTNENATGTGKNWVTDEPSSSTSNKWDTVLTALKNHGTSNKWALDSILSALKEEIKNDQTFSPEKRTKIENWCKSIKSEVFLGTESSEFKSQEDFCKVTS